MNPKAGPIDVTARRIPERHDEDKAENMKQMSAVRSAEGRAAGI